MEALREPNKESCPVLLAELERAVNTEIIAAYQYWTAYQLSCGPGKYDIDPILLEHTKQEWEHVELLSHRVRELGGKFCTDIAHVPDNASIWHPVTSGEVVYLANLIYEAEDRAVQNYEKLEKLSRDTDPVSHDIIVRLLTTETEHRYELDVLRKTL